MIVGRMASYVAKQALLGNTIHIFNCEQAIITGTPKSVQEDYWLRKKDIGQPQTGPFLSKLPDRFVRRIIRGMLSHRKAKGKNAYRRIMCYIGVPSQFTGTKMEQLSWASGAKLTTTKVQTIGTVCKTLGWQQ